MSDSPLPPGEPEEGTGISAGAPNDSSSVSSASPGASPARPRVAAAQAMASAKAPARIPSQSPGRGRGPRRPGGSGGSAAGAAPDAAGGTAVADRRGLILIVAIAVLAVVAASAAVAAFLGRSTQRAGVSTGTFSLAPGYLTFRSTLAGPDLGKVAEVPVANPHAVPVLSGVRCERSYTTHGTLLCLQSEGTVISTPFVHLYDSALTQTKKLQISGTPNRARVSADGRMMSWTTFISGDSYTSPGVSTRTSILDAKTGEYVDTLEAFAAHVDGGVYKSVDINLWGVTFTADDNTFYVTMGSAGRTWLMRGDLRAQTLTALRDNAECPSLSPDGTRLVFKKRVSDDIRKPWRFYVLDLATMKEHPLAEQRSVDDQAAWLNADTVMYAVPHDDDPGSDIYEVPADGSGAPTLLVADGMSPAVTTG